MRWNDSLTPPWCVLVPTVLDDGQVRVTRRHFPSLHVARGFAYCLAWAGVHAAVLPWSDRHEAALEQALETLSTP